MPRPRVRSQLAIQVPPDLLERLRAAAAGRRQTVTALVLEAIEAALSGAPAAAPPAAAPATDPAVLQRLEAIEAALAQLQQQTPPPAPERVEPLRLPLGPGHLEVIGAAHLQEPDPAPLDPPAAAPGQRLTTVELADLTRTNRAGWNNWAGAAPDRLGKVRQHPKAGSWRLAGKAPSPGGGPDRWLWERVEPAA